MLKHIPLTLKMLLITIIVSVSTWGLLDTIQTRNIKNTFHAQLSGRLSEEAEENRAHFDRYVEDHHKIVKILISQRSFTDYIEEIKKKDRSPALDKPDQIKYYTEFPEWLPLSSILRSLISFRYALLLDETGMAREVYQSRPEPPPPALLKPTKLMLQLSHKQNLLTAIDGTPYLITSESLYDPQGKPLATLMVACPLDNQFLQISIGSHHHKNIVALVRGENPQILASNKPDLLTSGTMLDSLQGRYLITGKSFFDYGASDPQMEFASFFPREEYESLSKSILLKERQNRALTALFLIISFSLIMTWITNHIQNLTRRVAAFSRENLGVELKEITRGDQLHILEVQFQCLKKEIVSSRESLLEEKKRLEATQEELIKKNLEIDKNRSKLQSALDKISSLIKSAANEKGFDVRFVNPHLKKCYELLNCGKHECPCHGKDAERCWHVAGTYCLNTPTGEFVKKYKVCTECPVFREATSDPIYQIGEHFNNMMHILETKNKELQEAYNELKATQAQILHQEKMASIGQLAAGVAHEINNPMGFISSNLGTLGKYVNKLTEFINTQAGVIESLNSTEASEGLKDKRRKLKLDYILQDIEELIKESIDGAERVKKIVQNLKSFSRIDEAEYKNVDINECIENTLNIVRNELKYKAEVKKDYGKLLPTNCYPQQLNQVFMNLLVNAAQAIEKQGEIGIRTWNGDGIINVSISDTGCGIPEDKISRIFEPFFTTKDVGKGTGLGLSITYDIVKKHNGEITVDSELGKGTTFTIKIPISYGK